MSSSEKIKVLVVASIFHIGGAEAITREIFKRIDKKRFEIIFCSLYEPGPSGDLLISDGFHFISNVFRGKLDIIGLFRLRKIINHHSIKIVYAINQPMTSFWVVLLGFLTETKTIAVSHNTFSLKSDWKLYIYFFVFEYITHIITVSDIQKKQIINEYGKNLSPISTIPNGIDTLKFSKLVNLERPLDSICYIGLVARLEYLKGVDVFLDAARIIMDEGMKVEFLIIGGGRKEAELHKQSKKLGIDSCVTFYGERQDVPELIQSMDITVLSSRTEAMPMVILEYMASRKAVVASNVGGISEIIQHGINGMVVTPNDPVKLAASIMELINKPYLREELAVNGYNYVNGNYRIDTTVNNTQALFETLLH